MFSLRGKISTDTVFLDLKTSDSASDIVTLELWGYLLEIVPKTIVMSLNMGMQILYLSAFG